MTNDRKRITELTETTTAKTDHYIPVDHEEDGTQKMSLATLVSGAVQENIEEDVNKWLEDHPEATTTVEDGSLTESKFADSLKLKAIKDYVTPQMYGAKGDGETDDTIAIQNAINSGQNVFFPDGTYLVSSQITIPVEFYKHTLFGNAKPTTHASIIKCTYFPSFVNEGAGFTIDGLAFTTDSIPVLSEGEKPEDKAYLYFVGSDDLDITIQNCYFKTNNCMIYAKGRNMYIMDNLFWDMNNANYCICLDYPDLADGESDTNVNGYKNAYSGFRGFIIKGNRCHYTRNWLLSTQNQNCQNLKGLVITDNYLEGAFCVIGYLNNALVMNNRTFQINHYDNTSDRRDACFNLIEMKNTLIDGYSCEGSDSYINKDGATIAESKFAYFMRVSGDCINNTIKNVFVSNFMYETMTVLGAAVSNTIGFNIRKTMDTNSPLGFLGNFKSNKIDVVINDIRNNPQTNQTIVTFIKSNSSDNIINVASNFSCIKYTGYIDLNLKRCEAVTINNGASVTIPAQGFTDINYTASFDTLPSLIVPYQNRGTSATAIIITTFTKTSITARVFNYGSTALNLDNGFQQSFLAFWF